MRWHWLKARCWEHLPPITPRQLKAGRMDGRQPSHHQGRDLSRPLLLPTTAQGSVNLCLVQLAAVHETTPGAPSEQDPINSGTTSPPIQDVSQASSAKSDSSVCRSDLGGWGDECRVGWRCDFLASVSFPRENTQGPKAVRRLGR
jgi:hypothetical protein